MKKNINVFRISALLCGFFLVGIFGTSVVNAYRDVRSGSQLEQTVNFFIEKGVLEGDGFFRPEAAVPARMFWEVLLREDGFDPEEPHPELMEIALPSNIRESDPFAPFLLKAIADGFISDSSIFDEEQEITRLETLEAIIKLKNLVPPRRITQAFRDKLPEGTDRTNGLRYMETAYASQILEDIDLDPLKLDEAITRRELINWLYRWNTVGKKQSRLAPENPLYSKRTLFQSFKNKYTQVPQSTGGLQIQVIDDSSLPGVDDFEGETLEKLLLDQVFDDVTSKYRFSDDLTEDTKKEMYNSAIAAMVKALGDKYSSYVKPEDSEKFEDDLSGEFEGIGAYVEMIDGDFMISAPIVGSPAEKAGVFAKDIVTRVDGNPVAGLDLQEIIKKIKGPAGTEVVLTVLRNGFEKKISVTRGEITVPAVTLKWQSGIPVLGIHQFNNHTTKAFTEYVAEIVAQNPSGLVIDLRNNPGGYLNVAKEVEEFFTHNGELVAVVEYKESTRESVAQKEGVLADQKNIVILQNGGTASASEILIGMLQDTGRARTVGTKTLGKGTVQSVSSYINGGMLKLTVAKWLTPKGRWIHEKGIEPDKEVSDPTPEERKEQIDRQLNEAVGMALRGW